MPTNGMTDIRTECKHPSAQRVRPARLVSLNNVHVAGLRVATLRQSHFRRIVVYDGAGQGGMTFKAFKHCHELLVKAKEVVENCECEDGCPACKSQLPVGNMSAAFFG